MSADAPSRPRVSLLSYWRTAVGLFLLCLTLSQLTAGGHDYSIDGAQTYHTAENLLLWRKVTIDEKGPNIVAKQGRDGHYYSVYGPGQTAALMPTLAAFNWVLIRTGMPRAERGALMRNWVPPIVSALMAAGVVVLVFVIGLQLGYGRNVAMAVAGLVFVSTPLWAYSRYDLAEPLQAFWILVAFLALIRAGPSTGLRHSLIAGAAVAALVSIKALFVLLAPVLLLLLLWRMRANTVKSFLAVSFAFGLPVLAAVLLFFGWNYYRFGDISQFGMPFHFSTPLAVGLYGLFLSPGRSVFLYAPLLLLSVVFAYRFASRHGFEAVAVIVISAPLLIAYAMFINWHGSWSWGPRYLVPLMPLWLLPVLCALASERVVAKAAVVVLAVAGIFVQALGVGIDPARYLSVLSYQVSPYVTPDRKPDIDAAEYLAHFTPSFSPVVGHLWLSRAALEKLRSPEKTPEQNAALQAIPWRRDWKPPNPEHGAELDVWLIKASPAQRRPYLVGAFVLALLGLGMLFWDRRRAAASRVA